MSTFIGLSPSISWPSSMATFETLPAFSSAHKPFTNNSELEDMDYEITPDEEPMDYEITPSEDISETVARIRQVEEDEKLAADLQAQYDAEFRMNVGLIINGRPQRNVRSSSYSQRSQNQLWRHYQSVQLRLQTINLLLRTRRPLSSDDSYESLLEISLHIGEKSKGLKKHRINHLPTRKFSSVQSTGATSDGSSSQDYQNCTICLCEYKDKELLRTLPCHHEFHAECIDKWLKLHNTCPICRNEISKQ